MGRSRRVVRSLAFCIGLLLLVGAGCLAQVTINHLNSSANGTVWVEFLKDAAAKYEALNPDVKISIQTLSSAQYLDGIAVRAASGVPVDVYQLYPSIAAGTLKNGLVLDLNPLVAKDPDVSVDDFIPFAVEAFMYEGKLWGLPCAGFPLINFYNIDLYQQNGLSTPNELGADFSWDRYIDIAKKLTQDKDGDGDIDQYGIFNNNDLWRWFVYANQAGGQVLNRLDNPDKSLFTTPAVKTGLQFLVDQFQVHQVAPVNFSSWPVATTFPRNQIGNVAINGPSFASTLVKTPGLNYDVSQLPHGPDNNATAVFMSSYQISSTSKHQQEAWKWIKFLSVDSTTVRDFVRATGRVPVLKRLLPEYQDLMPGSPAHMPVLYEMLAHPKVQTEYVSPVVNEIRVGTNKIVLQAIRGDIPVETALTQIDDIVSNLLSEGL